MGMLEKELRADIRKTKVNRAILTTIAVAGLMALGAVPAISFRSKRTRFDQYQVKSSFTKLLRKNYLRIERKDGRAYARLTPKGERFVALMGQGDLLPKKPKRWDKKWRLLIFDIPEKRRHLRVRLRDTLTTLGFMRLQDSVWVYPYDCEDYITLLKADLKIGKDVLYIIADKLELSEPLRQHFGLVLK